MLMLFLEFEKGFGESLGVVCLFQATINVTMFFFKPHFGH